ncbi:MAG: type II toxin-antitoxin system RelE/ParE family toxin [Planctomycetota bacterium]
MTERLHVLPEAEAEALATAEWYEIRRPGLGVEFMLEADEAIERIRRSPEAYPLWRRGHPYRKLAMRRFPFIVFFHLPGGTAEVVAFAHAKRKPGYWLSRL